MITGDLSKSELFIQTVKHQNTLFKKYLIISDLIGLN